jgi:hypothetical protein
MADPRNPFLAPHNPFAILARTQLTTLKVGSVIYKFCGFIDPPKSKYLVVASIEPRLLVLFINTNINKYYYHQKMDHFHVNVPLESHDFLTHDSYANCIEAHTAFDFSAIYEEVSEDYNKIFKGWLSDQCLEDVYHAVKNNGVMRTGHKNEITASIEKKLPQINADC